MFTNLIWGTSIALESLLLLRAAGQGLLKRYPLFYGYVGCVLVREIIGLAALRLYPASYDYLYWPAELVTVLASYAVMIEILRNSTRHHPGIRRLSQNALLIVLAFTTAYSGSNLVHTRFRSLSGAIADLGHDLRYVEGGLLVVMLWLLTRYRIPLGRNLMGLIIGYSFWVGISIVNLAFWFQPGNESSLLLRNFLSVSYALTLGIWCGALWFAHPEPVPPTETALERDYTLLAARTQEILVRTASRVARSKKP